MEQLTGLAKMIEIYNESGDKWIVHRLYQTISQQVLKEIKSYLVPGIMFDKATVWQIITVAMHMEQFSKDFRNLKSNKVKPMLVCTGIPVRLSDFHLTVSLGRICLSLQCGRSIDTPLRVKYTCYIIRLPVQSSRMALWSVNSIIIVITIS